MKQITKSASIWGFKDNYKSHFLPSPFKGIDSSKVPAGSFTLWDGSSSPAITLSRSVIKAVVFYCSQKINDAGLSGMDEKRLAKHLALGSKAATSGDDQYFCEFTDNDPCKEDDQVQCFSYSPWTGMIQGCIVDPLTGNAEEYETHEKALIHDGTGIWLCLLPYLEENSSYIREHLLQVREYLYDVEATGVISDEEAAQIMYLHVAPICFAVYKGATASARDKVDFTYRLCLEEGRDPAGKCHEKLPYLLDMADGPQAGKNITGIFKCLGLSEKKESEVSVTEAPEITVRFNRDYSELTAEEKALIPVIKKGTVITSELTDIIQEFNDNFEEEDRNLQVTQFLIRGGTGCGKSTMARMFAAISKRPYVSFQFSANTTEDDLKGILIPYTDDTEGLSDEEKLTMEAIRNSQDGMIDDIAVALSLPSVLDCELEPALSFEKITGHKAPTATYADAYEALSKSVFEKAVQIVAKAKAKAGTVMYKYIPSNVIRAIQNGWVIEFQEVNAVNQQSVLHCLFDVLEKASIGVVSTINGDVYRHPDFICFATLNEGYAGTHELNDAFANRFDYVEDMGSLKSDRVERLIFEAGIFGKNRKKCKDIAEVHEKIMGFVKEQGFNKEVSIRNLLHFAKALKNGRDAMSSAEHYMFEHIISSESDPDNYALLLNAVKDCNVFKR